MRRVFSSHSRSRRTLAFSVRSAAARPIGASNGAERSRSMSLSRTETVTVVSFGFRAMALRPRGPGTQGKRGIKPAQALENCLPQGAVLIHSPARFQ